ncbi:MAG: polyhydroxyalkanoate depolymerase [Alphaproteobacteria bacterium]|nr:polyhydroxyalkanoate depolymerase [Alphaproteobacteria bacterium]
MLYQLYDMQQTLLSPVRLAAEAVQNVFSHPMLPMSYTRFGRAMAAGAEMIERATRRYGKPAFRLDKTTIDGMEVPVAEEVVLSKPFCDLLHFKRETPAERDDPAVLVVAPMSGHYATLLRGTVEALLPDHDVYITDWMNAALVPMIEGTSFDLDDYVDYLIEFMEFLGPETHLIAVCQPSVPVMAAVSLISVLDPATAPRSMTLMGGPVDTRVNPTKVNKLAEDRSIEWFERTVTTNVPPGYPGFMRRVYPGFLQLTGFMSMNLDRHVGSAMKQYQHLVRGDGLSAQAHREFYDEYLSVMDLDAAFYLQTIRLAFQEHALPTGTWVSRGRKVDPGAIRNTALMTVEGELDDISGVGQTYAAHALCTNLPADRHRHWLQKNVGHYGIFNGKRWRGEIMPQVRDFIRENR